ESKDASGNLVSLRLRTLAVNVAQNNRGIKTSRGNGEQKCFSLDQLGNIVEVRQYECHATHRLEQDHPTYDRHHNERHNDEGYAHSAPTTLQRSNTRGERWPQAYIVADIERQQPE